MLSLFIERAGFKVDYIERTMMIRQVLLDSCTVVDRIGQLFDAHFAGEKLTYLGKGLNRFAYQVGTVDFPGGKLTIILKLPNEEKHRQEGYYFDTARDPNEMNVFQSLLYREFGAFEWYFDFVCGKIETFEFRNECYPNYCQAMARFSRCPLPKTFSPISLDTHVEMGDLGAVPFFHLVVTRHGRCGILTEGLPPVIQQQGTATSRTGRLDRYTVENHRIIDLDHCKLLTLDIWAGRDCLGLAERGIKYFSPEQRLDL